MGCLGHNSTSEIDKKIKINNTETNEIKIDSPKENEEKEIIIDESPFNKIEEILSEKEDINPYEEKETEIKNPFDDFGSDLEQINPFESFKLVYSRFLEFKNFLSTKHKAINQNDSNKKIIVITHSNFLGVITNKYLYDNDNINYFPKECCHCKN